MIEKNTKSLLEKIKEAEEKIEIALWIAVEDSDFSKELKAYEKVKAELNSLTNLPDKIEKERNRVLSFCLMRIDNTLVNLEDTENAVKRTKDALAIAEKSENPLAIARCLLAYGNRLIGKGEIEEAEKQFTKVFDLAENNPDEEDIQQTKGWALIVKGHLAFKLELYDQALSELRKSEEILKTIDNYAGIAQANELMAIVYQDLSDTDNADICKQKALEFKEKARTEKR